MIGVKKCIQKNNHRRLLGKTGLVFSALSLALSFCLLVPSGVASALTLTVEAEFSKTFNDNKYSTQPQYPTDGFEVCINGAWLSQRYYTGSERDWTNGTTSFTFCGIRSTATDIVNNYYYDFFIYTKGFALTSPILANTSRLLLFEEVNGVEKTDRLESIYSGDELRYLYLDTSEFHLYHLLARGSYEGKLQVGGVSQVLSFSSVSDTSSVAGLVQASNCHVGFTSEIMEYKPTGDAAEAINDQTKKEEEQRKKDEDNLNKAQSNSNSSSDSSSSDAESSGKNFIQTIQAFVDTVNNSTASDCRLSLDMGIANFGEADLCAVSLPQPVKIIATFTLAGLVLVMCAHFVKELIVIFRSFTGGGK